MAFVSSFAPLAAPSVRASSICGARVSAAPAAARAAVTMAASKSVPFLPAPKACEGLLGSADFDPLRTSRPRRPRLASAAAATAPQTC